MNVLPLRALATVAAIGLTSVAAQASTVDFAIDTSASSITVADSSVLTASLSIPTDYSFSLNVGESETFEFATWDFVGEGTTDVTVSLVFSAPSTTVGGSGEAKVATFSFMGLTLTGTGISWDSIVTSVAGGATFSVDFGDFTSYTSDNVIKVISSATVTLDAYTPPVPLPATGLMLVGAVGGLAALRRRKQADQQAA